jgi:RimJ/RimL family protein N-acetyltransferase
MNFIDFYNYHVPALEADEARHYALLHGFVSVTRRPTREFRGWTFGAPGACAIQPTPHWSVLLGALTEEQAHTLADDLAASNFPSVIGPGEAPDWFAARARQLGIVLDEPVRRHVLILEGLPRFPPIDGSARTVTLDDLALFSEWRTAYMREELPRHPPPSASDLEWLVGEGNFVFWTVGGEPVALAEIAAETNNGAAVSGTFAPESMRGRGYGAAAVAAAAQRILDTGHSKAFATVRMENAPALRNAIKVGFRSVAESTQYWRAMA